MRRALIILMGMVSATPAFACADGPLVDALQLRDAPGVKGPEIAALEGMSSEGGGWTIYFRDDTKTTRTIERQDFAEGGNSLTRLIIETPGLYGVMVRKQRYNVPYAVSGSRLVSETRDYYVFCDGALMQSDAAFDEGYEKAGNEAFATFAAGEIAAYLPARKQSPLPPKATDH